MDREILFRGKLKQDINISLYSQIAKGTWVYGDLVRLKDGEKTNSMIYGFGNVDTETIGQYTGVLDKNGVKIFEGDIIACENWKGKVFYSVDYGMFIFEYIGNGGIDNFRRVEPNTVEVVGNIYDNPELI